MAELKTVAVLLKDGTRCVINESDYEPNVHELIEDEERSSEGMEGGEGGDLENLNVFDALEIVNETIEAAQLDALEAEEERGKNRKTVFSAIEKRRESLKEE
jgi:hypothetical protein